MNFSQLQSLVALADTGSFTEAAYDINLTQSAVSHALASLESELGVTLLERNRKGVVSLTVVGQKIIPHVRALLAEAESIEQEARVAQGKASGKVRLGSINSIISPDLLASLLTSFQRSYPDMEVVLFEGAMQEVGAWIEDSVVDIGFVVLPAPNVECSLITTDELCILVPTDHRLCGRTAVTFKELREEGFILEKSQCAVHLLQRVGFGTSKNRPRIRYRASDSATILAMVREGLGITLLPRQMLPKKLEGIIPLPLDPPLPLQIGLAVKSARAVSPGTTLFLQNARTWAHEYDEFF
ncbi:LysR family transcriptional regulator [Dictyobacter aurantiacus]|uniref:LysR family transcriptional regulator n=1 Tax=Dictyobacter aurantiacus TaxID=1936993 RepID=A0A401ZD80_9CHLR|nr:LysR family transcriptional regulator [Dictyobacter aurantiacus]GCE04648.1 LysR family transcriptional regulator [Dictyobacter aurantiacus]